ncbi:carbohydrate-binding protein [Paenibacillus sp. KQZ6P-2]|uniref:Carbohydrate-binding protein n=1 Tax=Paenibacillus mangrovi TaxID=2931978 RepID=A0A9X2B443_9BACL|nr:carbohydrate-binding protein [Paenibacillus mangrovi]MCJ8014101.1 carbohydrate-binding protein [Paenibacillus mangrovi]
MKRILSVTLVFSMIFAMLSINVNAETVTSSAITWNSSDKDVAREIGYEASSRTDTTGDKIPSNDNSSNFPGIYFIWNAKQKDNGYLKVSADVFEKYDSFVLTSKESNKYWDFKIKVQDGQKMTDDGSYVFFIPKANNNKNISMVFIGNFIPKNANPLIASIKFDNNLKDDVNQKDLIANGNYSFVDGVLPGTKALHLESGNGNYVSTPNSLNFGEESFTVSFWYKGDTNNKQVILSNKDFSNGSNAGWAIYTSANSINMNLGFPTAKEKNISFGRNTFDASDWRHVTYVVDREKMLASLYIDGYEMAETTLKLGSLDTSNPLNIGSDGLGNLGGNSFDIADLMIWKGALSNDVVQTNYNSYDVNKVDLTALNNTIAEANAIIAGGLGNGFSESDFDYLKKVLNTATTVATTQKEKLYTQETINYYERELTNAIFIYQKSNKTATPADLNMIVDSDTEISDNPAAIARVENDFRTSLKLFPQADVFLIPGDVTGGNNAIEYLWMGELTNVYNKLKAEGLFDNIALYLVRGNHDMVKGSVQDLIPVGSAGAWNETTQSFDNNFFNDAYRVKIKGYNLVVFDGNYDNDNTSGKAKNFLDQITKEPDYDPTKPIFVSSHFPISGTNWGSGWSTSASNNVGKYIADNNLSQVVYVSGHTHYDPTDERSLYQGAASYFDAGSTNYSSYIDAGPYGGYIEGDYINYHTTPRIANFFEVYDTKVIIKHYNLSTDEFVGIPSVVHVGEGQDAFTYSKSDIRELIAPQFDEAITINSLKSNEVIFTMKQANDNVRVLEYNVQLINKLTGEVDKSFNSLSLPLDKPFDEHREYKITGLSPGTPYTLRVFAADSMYNRSVQDFDITTEGAVLSSITAPADKTAVDNGTAKTAAALGLPKTVKLVADDGSSFDVNVTWDVDASSYDPSLKTSQTFTVNGVVALPEGITNPNNVPLTTSIKVTVDSVPAVFMKAADYTSMNNVQIEDSGDIGGGKSVGYLAVGSWMEYTDIDIPSTGTYMLQYRVAVNNDGAAVSFEVDGVPQKTTSLPKSGGWSSWTTVSDQVTLTAGKHTIRLAVPANGYNINWFKLFVQDKI